MNKNIKKISLLAFAMVFFITISPTFLAEAAYSNYPIAEIHSENEISPKSDRIEWRYEIKEDGRLYKRLFNYSKNKWIGDWILVA